RDRDPPGAAFTTVLADPGLAGLEAGNVLQAYLPDSVDALEHLVDFARARVAAGGGGIKVRVVKGANLSMEHVDAELHGWEPAPYGTKAETDANFLRLVERVLRPELAGVVRLGVASHNLFDVALAHLLAQRRGATGMDVEMLQGMAPAQARAVREAATVVLYTPVVAPADFDVAVSYLVRRLEENAQPQNFLHALVADDAGGAGRPGGDGRQGAAGAMADQEARFRASVADLATTSRAPRRGPGRAPAQRAFTNTTDSDPALPAVRAWAAEAVRGEPAPLTSPVLDDRAAVDRVVAAGRAAQPAWAARTGAERAAVLRAAADELEARRGALVTVMAVEGGKTVAEADPEVSEAIDFARYYADRAEELDSGAHPGADGARFEPAALTLVTPPWNFPVAIPAGGVLAALAAGSAVVIKPAHAVPGCAEVAMSALHAALAAGGVPAAVLQVVRTGEGAAGRALVSHPGVDTVLLTGAIETARLFQDWRRAHPGGPQVLAETSGKNSLVVTPAADYDLAVADIVRSAFGHAGQKCSAASLVILVGSAGTSARLRRQLIDAVASLRVGWPSDLGTTMGPVIEPPGGKLRRALTTLEPGESWLVQPRRLDETGRLWSPGLKEGVAPGSFFHLTECFGPVLGIMRARTLGEAVALQNATAFGLTGGLHSLDEDEIARWLDTVEVGNAYVNRHTTGAIVRRQPFGGWKDSVVGPGAKAGGPNYVAQLGTWSADGVPEHQAEPSLAVRRALADYTGLVLSQADRSWLRAAVASDAAAWVELGLESDPSALTAEANLFRYRPAPHLSVRAGAGCAAVELVRVLLGAELTGTPVSVSLDPTLSDELKALAPTGEPAQAGLRRLAGVVDRAESRDRFVDRVRRGDVVGRVRVIGDETAGALRDLAGLPVTVLAQPVLATGRRELLTLLREQAVSRTRHRFGHLPPGDR
ncbi:proline dehydrogenase family protein, partial [Georgenia sp.]